MERILCSFNESTVASCNCRMDQLSHAIVLNVDGIIRPNIVLSALFVSIRHIRNIDGNIFIYLTI